MKRTFVVSGFVVCIVLSIAAFLQASGIVPAIVPALSPSTSRRGTTTAASGAGIFQLAANATAGSAGAAICDDGNGNTTTSSCLVNSVTSTSPVTVNTNTTSDQQLMELSLSAGYLNTSGQPFKFFGAGVYTTQSGQTPTLTFKVKLCTVSGCGSGTVVTLASYTSGATTASASNMPWNLSITGTTVTTGASGNLEVHGFNGVTLGTTAGAAGATYNDTNTAASSTINLTSALFVDFTITFSTNAATANTCTQREGVVSPGGAAAGGGGSGALTQISKVVTAGSATTVTFNAISGTYTDLLLTYTARTSAAANTEGLRIEVNSDTTSGDYSSQYLLTQLTTITGATVAGSSAGAFVANIAGTTSDANFASAGSISIQSYAATTFYKRMNTFSANAATTVDDGLLSVSASWKSTSAITSLIVSLDSSSAFINGSTFTLYGYQ